VANCARTNILSLGRCSSYSISSAVDAIPKGEGVIVLAIHGTPHTFDGRNCRFGRARGDKVNRTAEKFLSLQKLSRLNSQIQGVRIRHPKF
jgi:hypothetical protein